MSLSKTGEFRHLFPYLLSSFRPHQPSSALRHKSHKFVKISNRQTFVKILLHLQFTTNFAQIFIVFFLALCYCIFVKKYHYNIKITLGQGSFLNFPCIIVGI